LISARAKSPQIRQAVSGNTVRGFDGKNSEGEWTEFYYGDDGYVKARMNYGLVHIGRWRLSDDKLCIDMEGNNWDVCDSLILQGSYVQWFARDGSGYWGKPWSIVEGNPGEL
jgi:hypothetical protein